MIIKSMSRKEPSFGALMDYIDRELGNEATRIRHNVMGRGRDRVRGEFERNGHLLHRRKNGVYLYHEIISLTRAKGISPQRQHELLRQIVQQYIAARCPDNLCYGGMHQDKDHSYHFHLMISANRAGDQKRHRLTKAQFRDIQVKLEAHVLENYPELEQTLAIGKRAERKGSQAALEHERRTGRPPSRQEALLGRLRAAYEASSDHNSLEATLAAQGFRHEPRGKVFARVVDEYSTKPHRLKTLDAELAALIEARLQEPEQETQAQAEGATEREAEDGRAARGADEKEKTGAEEVDYGQSRAEARAAMDAEAFSAKDASTDNGAAQEPTDDNTHAKDGLDAQEPQESETLKEFRERRETREERKREKALKNLKRKGKPR